MTQPKADDLAPATEAAKSQGIPIHPPLAHITIGAFVTAAICDTISITGITDDGVYFNHAALYALMVGLGAMILAAIAGFVELFQNTRPGGQGRRTGIIHAVIMLLVGLLAFIDIITRESHVSESHTPGGTYALTLAVLVLLVIGGRLGGILVYRLGAGTSAKKNAMAVQDQ
jgi:uncharacterized membrane protein